MADDTMPVDPIDMCLEQELLCPLSDEDKSFSVTFSIAKQLSVKVH